MANYRPIYTKIWRDPDFEEYNSTQKLIFLYLCTNTATTESGIYPITLKTISYETKIPVRIINKYLDGGLKNVFYDFENNCVFIKNFLSYRSSGGRPDLLIRSIENDNKKIKTYLWKEFKKNYPEYSSKLITVGKQLSNSSKSVRYNLNLNLKHNLNLKDIAELSFNFSTFKFENLLETDKEEWKEIYDKVNIEKEILKMVQWLKAHHQEKRSHKKNWRKFITNWLNRCQVDLTEGIKNKELIEKMIKESGIGDIKDLDNPEFINLAKKCYKELAKTCNVTYSKKLNLKCIICLEKRGNF